MISPVSVPEKYDIGALYHISPTAFSGTEMANLRKGSLEDTEMKTLSRMRNDKHQIEATVPVSLQLAL